MNLLAVGTALGARGNGCGGTLSGGKPAAAREIATTATTNPGPGKARTAGLWGRRVENRYRRHRLATGAGTIPGTSITAATSTTGRRRAWPGRREDPEITMWPIALVVDVCPGLVQPHLQLSSHLSTAFVLDLAIAKDALSNAGTEVDTATCVAEADDCGVWAWVRDSEDLVGETRPLHAVTTVRPSWCIPPADHGGPAMRIEKRPWGAS